MAVHMIQQTWSNIFAVYTHKCIILRFYYASLLDITTIYICIYFFLRREILTFNMKHLNLFKLNCLFFCIHDCEYF